MDETVYYVTVTGGQTATLNVVDEAQCAPVTVLLRKIDAETKQNIPQGMASLENTEFTVKYYTGIYDTDPASQKKNPIRSWTFVTDTNGVLYYSEDKKMSGDSLYYDTQGTPILPIGTITIQETKAPVGYLLNPEVFVQQIRPEGTARGVNTYQEPTALETPQKGIIRLEKKSSEADYGTAVLEGAVYEVRDHTNTLVDTLTTDKAGKAQSKELPWGSYTVKEKSAPTGFLIDPNTHTVDLTTENTTEQVFYKTVISTEIPQKGIIALKKVDSETGKNTAQGEGTLEGALYDVFLKSAYHTGDNTKSPSFQMTMTTNKNGEAKSSELPLNIYYVIERKPSEGYLVDPVTHEVTLSAENRLDRVFTKNVKSEEDIIRGNVEIVKLKENEDKDEDTFEGLEGVEFTFTSDTTGKVVKKIVTDKNGFATTVDKTHPRGGLLYDTYTVTETKCPAGLKPIEPFQVTIWEESVTLKGIYKEDKLIVSPVTVVKVDGSTGKVIPVANTEFRLLDENKEPVTMTTYYPEKTVHKTFKTNENGQFTFPDKLKYSTYYLEEVESPKGYLKGELLEFKVTEGAIWENPLIVKYTDENAMGQIVITKTSDNKKEKLKGAVFEIRAAEDIVTPDGTLRAKKGDLVDTVTTGDGGTVTSKKLHLGKYEVKEIQQPDGFILNDEIMTVELKYKDQLTEVVTEEISVVNKPTEIEILKIDTGTKKALEGVKFKIWNKDMASDMINDVKTDANTKTKADQTSNMNEDAVMGITEEYITNKDGRITLKYLNPGIYCIQETETLPGYVLNEEIYEITIGKDGRIDGKDIGRQTVKNDFTKVDLSKHDILSGKEIKGGKYQVLDKEGNVIDKWKGKGEPHRIERLNVGETYKFSEIAAPEGYLIAQSVEFTIEPTGEVQKVKMYDELAMGTITIQKTDSETGEQISGALFEVHAAEDIVTPDGTVRLKKGELADTVRTVDGAAVTQKLFLGKYEVTEIEPAPGYVLMEKAYSVKLKYKDQKTAVVTKIVDVENTPTTIVLKKVKKGTEETLENVTFRI